jgi:hypothetical protein
VDPSRVDAAGTIRTATGAPIAGAGGSRPVEVVVNAVLAAPGAGQAGQAGHALLAAGDGLLGRPPAPGAGQAGHELLAAGDGLLGRPPAPGAGQAGHALLAAGDGLLGRLLADGHARIRDGRRGLDVGADACAIGSTGQPTPGLAVIGRATEDSVIGNDTLSRAMHPHADRWARRVAHRVAARAALAGCASPEGPA